MKKFLILAVCGTAGTFALAVTANILSGRFLVSWKLGEAGWPSAAIGFFLSFLDQALVFPAKLLSFGSQSEAWQIFGVIVGFSLWGLVFAIGVQRLTLRSSGTAQKRAAP